MSARDFETVREALNELCQHTEGPNHYLDSLHRDALAALDRLQAELERLVGIESGNRELLALAQAVTDSWYVTGGDESPELGEAIDALDVYLSTLAEEER